MVTGQLTTGDRATLYPAVLRRRLPVTASLQVLILPIEQGVGWLAGCGVMQEVTTKPPMQSFKLFFFNLIISEKMVLYMSAIYIFMLQKAVKITKKQAFGSKPLSSLS